MSRYAVDEIKNSLCNETNKTLKMIKFGQEVDTSKRIIIDMAIKDIRRLSILSNKYTSDYLKNNRIVIEDVEKINDYTDSCIKAIFNRLREW